jgi:hypothetical protein
MEHVDTLLLALMENVRAAYPDIPYSAAELAAAAMRAPPPVPVVKCSGTYYKKPCSNAPIPTTTLCERCTKAKKLKPAAAPAAAPASAFTLFCEEPSPLYIDETVKVVVDTRGRSTTVPKANFEVIGRPEGDQIVKLTKREMADAKKAGYTMFRQAD